MASEEVLRKTLKNADGKPFAKYKGIQNVFSLEGFEISFDEVQNDRSGHTYARVRVPLKAAGFPEDVYGTPSRKVAFRDLVARRFWESARTRARSPIPKTDGGEGYMPRPGQEILDRGCVAVTEYSLEARFSLDLPSTGGKVNASATEELVFGRIAGIVSDSMLFSAYKLSKMYNHVFTAENADFIRGNLGSRGLAAFVAEGSVLPRREDDMAPMIDAVPFSCDAAASVEFEVPNGDPVRGWGVPEGFTALVGPSRHGKSVLADAVFAGVYNHIPGDGREYVVSVPDAVYVMAEEGRPVTSDDMSSFISPAPGLDPSKFDSARASSPASEFAAVAEAMELGSSLVVVDEGYSNPSVIRKGYLSEDSAYISLSEAGGAMGRAGTSMLMVTGDESAVRHADSVFLVKDFKVSPVKVEMVLEECVVKAPEPRCPVSKNMSFEKGRKDLSVSAPSVRAVEIGSLRIEVPTAAFFDMSQTRAAADAVLAMKDGMDGSKTLAELCSEAVESLKASDSEDGNVSCAYHAYPRPIDVAAVVNRHPQVLMIRKGRALAFCCTSPASC